MKDMQAERFLVFFKQLLCHDFLPKKPNK